MLPSVFKTCIPREEILEGELSSDLFAAKLRLVVEGLAPQVYQDPTAFFANTFATDGLKTLISEVFGRLVGAAVGSPIIRLETSFGGGKTHDEIALWHIAKNGRDISGLDRFVDLNLIPDRPIQAAAIACQDLDPVNGVYHADTGVTTYTLWGEIAYQINGVAGYSLLKGSDEQRVSPGTVVLERIIQGQPTVIIIDEIASYLRKAKATLVGNSNLAGQVVAFLFALMDLAASCNNLVFVYTLASSTDSFGEETTEIRETISATARQERIIKPSTDIEIYNIVKQRVFASIEANAANNASKEYLQTYKASRINLPDGCKDARYADSIEQSYPFHPELFNLLTKKIASIPNFQRTRGALRLFARVIRYLWQSADDSLFIPGNSDIDIIITDPPYPSKIPSTEQLDSFYVYQKRSRDGIFVNSPQSTNWIPLIHSHHIPVGIEEEITSDLTARLERPLMRITIQADIYNKDGREAHAQLQDAEWKAAGKPPFSTWVARTIFLHSITQGISAGIRRAELNLSLLTPGLEIGFVDTALERLSEVAWYLENDPMTTLARFKEEPSINKIIAEEKAQVGITEAKDDLRSRRDAIFANRLLTLVIAPESPADVDDVSDSIALCLIDFNEATISVTTEGPPPMVEKIFNETGESGKFRTFRNRLLFLVANRQELERAIDNAREFRAIQNILNSPNRLQDLSENQQKQLKDKKGSLDLGVRVSLTNAYRHLFYPANDPVKAPKGLMHYTLPAQDSSDVKGKNNQQDVILKALKDCQKIRADDTPFAPAYILQKVWLSGLNHWTTKALKEAFAKDLSLNIFVDAELSRLKDTIRQGLQSGNWDMKVGEKLFIKTDDGKFTLPDSIEFSERMVLYRRGILELPKPREIELNAQVLSSTESVKPVRIRWKASGALTIKLYQDGNLVTGEFRPSDEHETAIAKTTTFKIVADYGNGEVEERETLAKILAYGTGTPSTPSAGEDGNGSWDDSPLFKAKPEEFDLEGTLDRVFNELGDRIQDNQVQGIQSLEISVGQVMDYRKLMTAFPMLIKLPLQIDQTATITVNEQFIRLEYQGPVKGFQSFQGAVNTLLSSPDVKADVSLKLVFEFSSPVQPNGAEISTIKQALNRNPVDRLNLTAKVTY